MRRATRNPAIWAGVAPPVMMVRMTAVISSALKSWRSMHRAMASRSSMSAALHEVAQQVVPVAGQDGLGVELDPLMGRSRCRTPMISSRCPSGFGSRR
jgi:hypothetical protein